MDYGHGPRRHHDCFGASFSRLSICLVKSRKFPFPPPPQADRVDGAFVRTPKKRSERRVWPGRANIIHPHPSIPIPMAQPRLLVVPQHQPVGWSDLSDSREVCRPLGKDSKDSIPGLSASSTFSFKRKDIVDCRGQAGGYCFASMHPDRKRYCPCTATSIQPSARLHLIDGPLIWPIQTSLHNQSQAASRPQASGYRCRCQAGRMGRYCTRKT
jgi:hypothetical protein